MKMFSRILLAVFLFLLSQATVVAQKGENGNWLMFFGTNKISNHLSIHLEAQYRNHTLAPVNIDQLLLRLGLNYHITENSMFSAGYAYVSNHQFKSEQQHPEIEEHRIWQQFILRNKVNRFVFEHRYRVEERWIANNLKGRLRYRLLINVPLNKKTLDKGALFFSFYDEIFVNTTTPFYDRNRFYLGLGYQLRDNVNIQIGMMQQELSDNGKWNFQLSLTWNPDLRKKTGLEGS